jgi:hypothetical protein
MNNTVRKKPIPKEDKTDAYEKKPIPGEDKAEQVSISVSIPGSSGFPVGENIR